MKYKTVHSLPALSLASLAGVIFKAQSAQAAMIVVDFDDPNNPSTQSNYNQMFPSVNALTDLIDVNGVQTGIDFRRQTSVTFDPPSSEAGLPPLNQIPTNSPITQNIGGVFTSDTVQTYWFRNLEPGSLYKIYIFSFRGGEYFNTISVTTQVTVPTINVSGNNELYVNDERGSNTRTLESYTDLVTVWTAGPNEGAIGFTFNVDPIGGGFFDQWAIAGVAIEEVPIPEPSTLLGLGMIGGVLLTKRGNKGKKN